MSRHSGAREVSRLDAQARSPQRCPGTRAKASCPTTSLEEVLAVLERASSRRSLSADHTVVGFFGATGSGKSSLFNAVSGAEIATAAARRPTTSEPLAGVWGADGSEPLLDWLEVRNRHHAAAVDGFADEDTGLILLDLPDFDSTRAANREIVQRMVGLVDVLVWVLDPQKYADAAVHNDFLAPPGRARRRHPGGAQPDRPAAGPGRRSRCWSPCKGILARDGLGKVQVLGASALTGRRRGQGPGRHPAAWWCSARPPPSGWPPMSRGPRRNCGRSRATGRPPASGRSTRRGWRTSWPWPPTCPLVVRRRGPLLPAGSQPAAPDGR